MKIHFGFFLLFFVSVTFAQNNPSHFKTDIDFGNGTVFTTFFDLTFNKNGFALTSPKDADVRIFGGKAKLGRAMGMSPKKGIFVAITGTQRQDSLFGEAAIPMIGKVKFKGIVKGTSISGAFIRDTTTFGSLRGVASTENRLNFTHLYPLVLKTVRENIYSKEVLQSKEWKSFQEDIEALCTKAHDDIEMYLGFNMLSRNLPFSHFNLMIASVAVDTGTVGEDQTSPKSQSVVFEQKSDETAYLQIKNFSTSTAELSEILPQIVANKNYKNLIVDLRNNPGGGVEAAFAFAKYIIGQDTEVGYFVTNKLQYSGYQPELFKLLPELQPKSTEEFTNDLQTTSGAKLILKKPTNPVFEGKLYVLTNRGTGSTSEPVVYTLKKSNRATIIGEKTAGAMLAAVRFNLEGKYNLFLPIADFYTTDGIRLDKVGVTPNIEVDSDDALTKALELIATGPK